MKINEYNKKNGKKIKGCIHKDTYNSAANYFRQPLLIPNNAKALHFYQIVYLTNFLTFSLININQNIKETRENFGVLTNLRICQLLVILNIL